MADGTLPSVALPLSDAVPLVRWWLARHPAVIAALANPVTGLAGTVSMLDQPPWPDLVISDTTAGSDGDLRRLMSPEIQLEAYGDLDGSPGKAALRNLLYTAIGAMRELGDAPYPYGSGMPAGAPVVTEVESSRAGGYVPLATGQPRYVGAVRLYVHPA